MHVLPIRNKQSTAAGSRASRAAALCRIRPATLRPSAVLEATSRAGCEVHKQVTPVHPCGAFLRRCSFKSGVRELYHTLGSERFRDNAWHSTCKQQDVSFSGSSSGDGSDHRLRRAGNTGSRPGCGEAAEAAPRRGRAAAPGRMARDGGVAQKSLPVQIDLIEAMEGTCHERRRRKGPVSGR